MRESRPPGSVRGAPGDGRPYRDRSSAPTHAVEYSGEYSTKRKIRYPQVFVLQPLISLRTALQRGQEGKKLKPWLYVRNDIYFIP